MLGHGGEEAGIGAGSGNSLTWVEQSVRRGSWSPPANQRVHNPAGVKDCGKVGDLFGSVNVRGFSTRKMPGAVSLVVGA